MKVNTRRHTFIICTALILVAHLGLCLPKVFRWNLWVVRGSVQDNEDSSNFNKIILFIKETTPENSIIVLPSQEFARAPDLSNAGYCDYFLFPRILIHKNDQFHKKSLGPRTGPVYRIDAKGFEYSGEHLKRYELDDDFGLVLLREGLQEPAINITDYSKIESNTSNVMFALLKLLLIITAGSWLVLRYFEERSLLSFLAASFLAGTAVSAVAYIVLNFAGIDFSETLQFAFLALVSMSAVFYYRKHRSGLFEYKKIGLFSGLAQLTVLFFFGAIIFASMFMKPAMLGDGCAIWAPKAKSIFAFHNMNALKTWGAWPHYPPLLTILMSQMAVGGEKIVKLVFPIFTLCLYLTIYSELAKTKYPAWLKIYLPLALLITPMFFMHSFIGYANLALTAFVVKAAFMLPVMVKESGRNRWVSFSIILCGIVLVRPEGVFWAFCLAMTAFFYAKHHGLNRGQFTWHLIPFACGLLWAAYVFFIMKYPLSSASFVSRSFFSSGTIASIFTWDHLSKVSINLVKYSLSLKYWGLINLSFLMLFLLKGFSLIKRNLPVFTFLMAGFFGISMLSYILTVEKGWPVDWFFYSTFDRLLMTIVPIAFIVLLKEVDYRVTSQRQ